MQWNYDSMWNIQLDGGYLHDNFYNPSLSNHDEAQESKHDLWAYWLGCPVLFTAI